MGKLENKYKEIQELENSLQELEDRIEAEKESFVQSLAKEAGLKVGDMVDLGGEKVVIYKFKLTYSNNYMIGKHYKDLISKEKYAELTKREFALGAYCYLTTVKGAISKRENPMNIERVLENYEKVE